MTLNLSYLVQCHCSYQHCFQLQQETAFTSTKKMNKKAPNAHGLLSALHQTAGEQSPENDERVADVTFSSRSRLRGKTSSCITASQSPG